MRIERIEATPFAIPYKEEVTFATGALSAAEHVLLRVVTAEGAVGTAEVIPRPMIYGETVASVVGALDAVVRPLLCGHEVGPGRDLQRRLRNLVANNTLRGALDIALWDAAARLAGMSCWRMLGGDRARAIELTAILGLGHPAHVVDQADRLVHEHGFRSFKLKVGIDLARDVATCRALRERFPDALIYVDANHGFTPEQATWFGRRTEELDLAWIEEPVDGTAVAGRELAARQLALPVLGDESTPDLRSAARELIAGRSDMISVKVARTGFTESAQILALCEALGSGIVVGSQGDSELGTLAGLQFSALGEPARQFPAELSYFATVLDGRLLREPLEIRDGRIRIPDGPGLGVDIDDEELQRYAA
ncbi:MAG TPA: mandelate racemase/muconate lactonizing enzyme family protein [Thermoleophilaceae bacterium]|jgi:L-alanine-DL-glutamate epimerase-like enolase superfamily enzyme|nr:mandelate racemase/muconate lactonizing enzyme family protein [Thermoleophilaceae bacterium]